MQHQFLKALRVCACVPDSLLLSLYSSGYEEPTYKFGITLEILFAPCYQARIAFLVGERRGQENLKKDLVRRIKMLEYALKQERVKFHQFKASVAAQSNSRPPTDDAVAAANTTNATAATAVSPRFSSDVSKPKPLEPCEKLAQCTKQAMESRAKWLESRGRLRQFLQEVGSADTFLNIRQARVLQLLMSTPGWRGALDQEGGVIDPSVKQHLRLDGSWPAANPDGKTHGMAGTSDEQIRSALAEIEQAVRVGGGSRPELGDDCAEPDTTGQSLGGSDSYDSDSTWVNRFRRTGGHSSGEHGRLKQAAGLGDELDASGASGASAVSSFISGLKEGNTGEVELSGENFGESINVNDFICSLSEDVEEENTGRSVNAAHSSTAPASSDEEPDIVFNFYPALNPRDSTQITHQIDAVKEAVANEGLVLGDLATVTVANDLESGADAENCDVTASARGEFDHNLLDGQSGPIGENQGPIPYFPLSLCLCACVCTCVQSASQGKASTGRGAVCPMAELEPVHVYCGHDGPVLSVVTPSATMISSSSITAYTGGLDGTVRAWRLPSLCSTTGAVDLYAPHELEIENGPTLRGSRGSVWALAMHPSSPILTAAHSDCAIEFWSTIESTESVSTPTFTVHLDRVFKGAREFIPHSRVVNFHTCMCCSFPNNHSGTGDLLAFRLVK
ncbi:hypothetical protein FGIG_10624 [Fasciola gigantica]|uniref:Striatin N-terminal domain-containing protein n=1 Tax=Fasciola gigantica TaxID=46835 RepID=A0A504YKW9_FASGI|nr:hypothetical protein FGIG_10624 [Fasciola gigantica]